MACHTPHHMAGCLAVQRQLLLLKWLPAGSLTSYNGCEDLHCDVYQVAPKTEQNSGMQLPAALHTSHNCRGTPSMASCCRNIMLPVTLHTHMNFAAQALHTMQLPFQLRCYPT